MGGPVGEGENPILYSFDKSFRKPESQAPLARKGAHTAHNVQVDNDVKKKTHTKQINKKTTQLRRDPRREVPAACLEYKIWFLFIEHSRLLFFETVKISYFSGTREVPDRYVRRVLLSGNSGRPSQKRWVQTRESSVSIQ